MQTETQIQQTQQTNKHILVLVTDLVAEIVKANDNKKSKVEVIMWEKMKKYVREIESNKTAHASATASDVIHTSGR